MAVTGLDIEWRRPFAGARPFGETGPYEHVAGTLHFAVNPQDPANGCIVDLDLAPREAGGKIHFSADFALIQPVDPNRGRGRLLFDVLNRGTARALAVFNEGGGEPCSGQELDPGNGFLMRRGYTVAWCGWQQDLPPHGAERMGLYGPTLPDSVQGFVLCEFQPVATTDLMELSDLSHQPYPPVRDGTEATLSVRDHTEAPRRLIPMNQWRFVAPGGKPVRSAGFSPPYATHISLDGGFQPGLLYEAVYRAQGARVVGLGLLSARDVLSWLRYDPNAPPRGALHHAYGFGRSQSGRFLRHFLYLGLNQDEAGRQAFDGVMPLVAGARRGEFNLRFGQPSKTLGQGVGALPPFSDAELIPQARAPAPHVMNINSSAEYWGGDRGSGGQASLLHNDGERDLDLAGTSRVYFLAGTQHVGAGIPPEDVTSTQIKGRYAFNCVNYNPYLRAALVNLDRWVTEGQEPPPSRYPRLDDGTAISPEAATESYRRLGFAPPRHLPRLRRMEFETLPPKLGEPYRHYVSALDGDGNEVAGIRPPEVAVPLATYTGWNTRHPEAGAPGELIPMIGATIPFSLETIARRYRDKEDYLQGGRTAAEALAKERYILEADIDPILARMAQLWDWLQKA